jgi:hypothetical protein
METTFTFAQAFELYERGLIIESVESGRTFMKGWENDEDAEIRNSQSFDPYEVRGLWILNK